MRSFSQMPIDTQEIAQRDLNLDERRRTNLFAWNGQFSPQLVETLLDRYSTCDTVVLDPFAGSGTTLCESARRGVAAYGVELNPSAYFMAKTYELASMEPGRRAVLVAELEAFLLTRQRQGPSLVASLVAEAPACLRDQVSLLVILLDLFANEATFELLMAKWRRLKEIIIGLPHTPNPIRVQRGDARKLQLPEGLASLLITSPPYINVFNYHQKYRRSVEALGYDVLSIARAEIGANRKNRGNRFLTIIQYCMDMGLSLKEAVRVCREGSRMIYIVGRESSVLGYSFCNSRLLFELATDIFGLRCILRQERFFRNRFGQVIYEDILHFENSATRIPDDDDIMSKARETAVRMLEEKVREAPENEHATLIRAAIEKRDLVDKSEEATWLEDCMGRSSTRRRTATRRQGQMCCV